MNPNRRASFKQFREMYEAIVNQELQQTQHIHVFTLVALASPICVAMAGCYFTNNGQPAGTSITAIGSFTTLVCIPLATVSLRDTSRRFQKLKKEVRDLMNVASTGI